MGIQSWSDDVILGDLQREPQLGDELKTVIDLVNDRRDCDVILDFSNVDIITSPSLSKLLRLRQALADSGHRLIICSVRELARGAFKVTGLDGFFELAADRAAASQQLGVEVSQ
jgi:anti-anti-sigma factor